MSKSLRIELKDRPGNAVMQALLALITCVFGSGEKELEYQKGGRILIIEDSPENLQLLATVLEKRSWNDQQFEAGRHDRYFKRFMSDFGGQEKWSEFLNKVIDNMVMSTTMV